MAQSDFVCSKCAGGGGGGQRQNKNFKLKNKIYVKKFGRLVYSFGCYGVKFVKINFIFNLLFLLFIVRPPPPPPRI
jgi:hypothetical protein